MKLTTRLIISKMTIIPSLSLLFFSFHFSGLLPAQTLSVSPVAELKTAASLAIEGKPIEATAYLYSGLNTLGSHAYADTVMKEMWDILTVEELKAYPETGDQGRFLLKAWKKRDLTPATPENERYTEHMKRLAYARRYFSSPQPRGYDDRGMIYVRYGEPDDRAIQISPKGIRPNEAWVYYRYTLEIIVNFVQVGAMLRLSKTPADYCLAADAAMVSPLSSVPPGLGEFLENRQFLHPKYAKLFALLQCVKSGNQQERKAKRSDLASTYYETYRHFQDDLDEHPHAISGLVLPGKLTGHLNTARFLRDGVTQLELYLGIPLDQLTDSTNQATLRFSCTVTDDAMAVYEQMDRMNTLTLLPQYLGRDLSFSSQLNLRVPPGHSQCAVSVGHVEERAVFKREKEIQGFDAANADLFLSDIQLASAIEPVPANLPESQKIYVKNDLLIRPYAFREINPDRTLYLYLEAYNLNLDMRGHTQIEIHWTVEARENLAQKLNPFDSRGYSLSSSFKQNGHRRNAPVYIALDISRLMPGEYNILFNVKDSISSQEAQCRTFFKVKKR